MLDFYCYKFNDKKFNSKIESQCAQCAAGSFVANIIRFISPYFEIIWRAKNQAKLFLCYRLNVVFAHKIFVLKPCPHPLKFLR